MNNSVQTYFVSDIFGELSKTGLLSLFSQMKAKKAFFLCGGGGGGGLVF